MNDSNHAIRRQFTTGGAQYSLDFYNLINTVAEKLSRVRATDPRHCGSQAISVSLWPMDELVLDAAIRHIELLGCRTRVSGEGAELTVIRYCCHLAQAAPAPTPAVHGGHLERADLFL